MLSERYDNWCDKLSGLLNDMGYGVDLSWLELIEYMFDKMEYVLCSMNDKIDDVGERDRWIYT